MTEPDVAITDYFLALESLTLAALLAVQPATRPDFQLWFVVFLAATGVAAALGGTFHGFFVARPSRDGRLLWRSTLIVLGVMTSATWMIGGELLWPGAHTGLLVTLVVVELVMFAAVVVLVDDAFRVAVIHHLPATLFLIAAYLINSGATPDTATACGLAGLALTVIAGLVQRMKVAVHRTYFTHNAVCHVVQGVAVLLMFWSGQRLMGGG